MRETNDDVTCTHSESFAITRRNLTTLPWETQRISRTMLITKKALRSVILRTERWFVY